MGHKTHPIGFRLGITKEWQARWYADKPKEFSALLLEDVRIREAILTKYHDAGISRVEIERSPHEVVVSIHTARPGIVIGRGGQRVEELRKFLEQLTQKRARLNIQEIRQPELDAFLVARSVADQLERRIAFRRAIRQSVSRTMQAGAKGIKVLCSGRLGGAEIARKEKAMQGRVPLHTLRGDIDFAIAEAHTTMGRVGVKVWIYKGDIVPRLKEAEAEEMAPIEVTLKSEEEGPEARLAEATAIGQALAPVLLEEVKEETPQPVAEPSTEESPQKVEAAEGAKKRPTRSTTKKAVAKAAKEKPAEGKVTKGAATVEKKEAVEIAAQAPVELEPGEKRSRKKTVVKEGIQDATAQKGEVPKGSSRKTKGQSSER